MAIAHRSSSVASTAGATSLTITAPAGIVNGDVLVALINANTETTTITPPAGWSLIKDITTGGAGTANYSTFYKVASSESGDYQFSFNTSQRASGGISVFSGAYSTPINASSSQWNDVAAAVTAPAITTTKANCMILYAASEDTPSVLTWTPPSGMTESFDNNSAQGGTLAYVLQASAGSTGNKTGTPSITTGSTGAFLIALEPNISSIKKVSGVSQTSVKKVLGTAIASVKKLAGVSNV